MLLGIKNIIEGNVIAIRRSPAAIVFGDGPLAEKQSFSQKQNSF
jgi:hypothetical protein